MENQRHKRSGEKDQRKHDPLPAELHPEEPKDRPAWVRKYLDLADLMFKRRSIKEHEHRGTRTHDPPSKAA